MDLNLERVIRFYVVAEEMSFTRAARRLQVDQPWLSRQIQQLEAQLGFALFERTTRKIALTPEGRALLEQARKLAAVADDTRTLARSLDRARRQELRLGVVPSSYWVPGRRKLLEIFASRYPRVTVELSTGVSPRLLVDLRRHKIDIAIITPTFDLDAYDYIPLHRSTPGLLIPHEHPLLKKDVILMRDLEGLQLAATDRAANPFAYDRMFQPFFDAGMISRPVAEGRVALAYYVRAERILMLGFEKKDIGAGDLIYRDVADCPAVVENGLARMAGDDRDLVRKLWGVARTVAAEAGLLAEPGLVGA